MRRNVSESLRMFAICSRQQNRLWYLPAQYVYNAFLAQTRAPNSLAAPWWCAAAARACAWGRLPLAFQKQMMNRKGSFRDRRVELDMLTWKDARAWLHCLHNHMHGSKPLYFETWAWLSPQMTAIMNCWSNSERLGPWNGRATIIKFCQHVQFRKTAQAGKFPTYVCAQKHNQAILDLRMRKESKHEQGLARDQHHNEDARCC